MSGRCDASSKWLIEHLGEAIPRLCGLTGVRSCKAVHSERVRLGQLPNGPIEAVLEGDPESRLFLVEMAAFPEPRVVQQHARGATPGYVDRGIVPEVVAVVLHRRGRRPVPPQWSKSSRFQSTEIAIRWRIVELWKLSAEKLLAREDPGLVPWSVPCSFDGSPEPLFRRCREIIDRRARGRTRGPARRHTAAGQLPR